MSSLGCYVLLLRLVGKLAHHLMSYHNQLDYMGLVGYLGLMFVSTKLRLLRSCYKGSTSISKFISSTPLAKCNSRKFINCLSESSNNFSLNQGNVPLHTNFSSSCFVFLSISHFTLLIHATKLTQSMSCPPNSWSTPQKSINIFTTLIYQCTK